MSQYGFENEDFNKASYLEEYYQFNQEVDDDRFGKIKILENKYNPEDIVMLKEKVSDNLYDCERDIFQAKERMRLQHDCLLKMVDFSTKSSDKDPRQSKSFLVSGYYEFPQKNLQSELVERAEKNQPFSDKEILKLILNMLECLAFLQQNKMVHGDIRPKYVAYNDSEAENHKLVDRLGDPSPPNQVQLNNIRKKKPLYMSNNLYQALVKKQQKIRHNPYKSDSFSLGLVLLECGNLRPIQNIFEAQEISTENLLEHLNQFMNRYDDSDLIKEMILNMLDIDERERKDPRKLLRLFYEMMSENEQQMQMQLQMEMEKQEQQPEEDEELDYQYEEENTETIQNKDGEVIHKHVKKVFGKGDDEPLIVDEDLEYQTKEGEEEPQMVKHEVVYHVGQEEVKIPSHVHKIVHDDQGQVQLEPNEREEENLNQELIKHYIRDHHIQNQLPATEDQGEQGQLKEEMLHPEEFREQQEKIEREPEEIEMEGFMSNPQAQPEVQVQGQLPPQQTEDNGKLYLHEERVNVHQFEKPDQHVLIQTEVIQMDLQFDQPDVPKNYDKKNLEFDFQNPPRVQTKNAPEPSPP